MPNYLSYGGERNPEQGGKTSVGKLSGVVKLSNLDHLIVSEFGAGSIFSPKNSPSSLLLKVNHIIGLSPKFEVPWVAASPVSNAAVQYKQTVWNILSVTDDPSKTMDGWIEDNHSSSLDGHMSISIGIGCSVPIPAIIRTSAVHLGPEPFLEFRRQQLRQQLRWDNLRLHNQVCFVCATLSADDSSARAFLL